MRRTPACGAPATPLAPPPSQPRKPGHPDLRVAVGNTNWAHFRAAPRDIPATGRLAIPTPPPPGDTFRACKSFRAAAEATNGCRGDAPSKQVKQRCLASPRFTPDAEHDSLPGLHLPKDLEHLCKIGFSADNQRPLRLGG